MSLNILLTLSIGANTMTENRPRIPQPPQQPQRPPQSQEPTQQERRGRDEPPIIRDERITNARPEKPPKE